MPTPRYIIVAAALTMSCAFGCNAPTAAPPPSTRPASATPPNDAHPPEYWDVIEAVFRHQFDHNASAGKRNVDYFFISVENSDPPEALLTRFAAEKPPVLPASLAASSPSEGVRHKELGGRGLKFRISSVKWLDADTAEVQGGYYEGGLSSSGNVYRVERHGGKWSVTKDEMRYIS
jgi:hypothetical protein